MKVSDFFAICYATPAFERRVIQKYHNTLCLPSKILHKHCFQFLLRLTMIRRENKNNAYPKFWRANKDYCGIFESGLYKMSCEPCLCAPFIATCIIFGVASDNCEPIYLPCVPRCQSKGLYLNALPNPQCKLN